MKKHLTTLLLAVLVSNSFIGCDFNLYGDEGPAQVVEGYKYKFTSSTLKLGVDNGHFECKVTTRLASPVYRQYEYTEGNYSPYWLRVDSVPEGDTLIIYGYHKIFNANISKEEQDNNVRYFRDNYKKYFIDSVLIIGPSPIYDYSLPDGDSLSLEKVYSICP